MSVTQFLRGARCALPALLVTSCHLFGAAEVSCDGDLNCYSDQRCHPVRHVCVAPAGLPPAPVDGGAADVSLPDVFVGDVFDAGVVDGDISDSIVLDNGVFEGPDGGLLLFFDDFDTTGTREPDHPAGSYWYEGQGSDCLEIGETLHLVPGSCTTTPASVYAEHLGLGSGGGPDPDGLWRLRGRFSLGTVGAGSGHALRILVQAYDMAIPCSGLGFMIDSEPSPPTLQLCTQPVDCDFSCDGSTIELPGLSAGSGYAFELELGRDPTIFTLWEGDFDGAQLVSAPGAVDLLPRITEDTDVHVMVDPRGTSTTSTWVDDLELRRFE